MILFTKDSKVEAKNDWWNSSADTAVRRPSQLIEAHGPFESGVARFCDASWCISTPTDDSIQSASVQTNLPHLSMSKHTRRGKACVTEGESQKYKTPDYFSGPELFSK